jgi:hypothetical protein
MLGKINWNPSTREIRMFALVLIAGFGFISLLFLWRGKPAVAGWIFGLAGGAAVLSAAIPPAGRVLYKIWMAVGFCIGFVVSKIILILIFFGLFTPVGILFKLIGRDELAVKKRNADTYWKPLPPSTGSDEFKHLF